VEPVLRFTLLVAILFSGVHAFAGSVRARWRNSQELAFKLPKELSSSKGLSFQLSAQPAIIQLPVLRHENELVILNTSQIPANKIDALIRSPLKVIVKDPAGRIVDTTGIQYSGILDELYRYDGDDLGARVIDRNFQVKLWAPTAQKVRLIIYGSGAEGNSTPYQLFVMNNSKGVWGTTVPYRFKNYFYRYEVTVFHPQTDRVETFLVTDPYSFGLSSNGGKTQLLDPLSAEQRPSGWAFLEKPVLNSFKDIVLYEMQIRDFSANDESVPFMYRGSYSAFSQKDSNGMKHLKSLSAAGLTHIHLLPFNDFGSVNENKNAWQAIGTLNGNLEDAQTQVGKIRQSDAFNWGYDPVHYLVPEGSYAINPATRMAEVRAMVRDLNLIGLRVVQDVVFNHTYSNALDNYSVFDKIVPLYYYRTDDEGNAYRSSCCYDTASEHAMMEKLIVDSVLYWARTYKIDAFRFDLMGFHSRSTMAKIKKAVQSLTLKNDGVDGTKIYLYGEGWSFGSFYEQHPREAMTQGNSYGMGIGLFNDHLRDAVRGGTTNASEKSDQGFATGLYFDFNHDPANRNTPITADGQRDKLLHLADIIKVGLAGNLRDYSFREHLGSTIRGGDLYSRSNPVANAAQAIETINYVSAHDGYSLWDAVQAKAPFNTFSRTPVTASLQERVRMQQLALAIPLLSQGIPFIEGGSEILRSKNGDQDSYDSGDFFNRLDWTGTTNYWGEALPPSWKNFDDWAFWQPRLLAPELKVTANAIAQSDQYFKALLQVRQSSDLFKMNSLEEIKEHLSFIDSDNGQEPGLIAMHLQNKKESILVFFNSSKEPRSFSHKILSQSWSLDSHLNAGSDPTLEQVSLNPSRSSILIPGMSTVVIRQ
jgi:pullulanase